MHNIIAIGASLRLDRRTRTLSNIKDGNGVTLPASACRCLKALVEEKENVLSYEQLMDIGWRNAGVEVTENSVRVMITKIRRALVTLKVDEHIQLIAVTRSGYRLIVNKESVAPAKVVPTLSTSSEPAPPSVIARAEPAEIAPPSAGRVKHRVIASVAGAALACLIAIMFTLFFKMTPQPFEFARWQGEGAPAGTEVWVPKGPLSSAQRNTVVETLQLYTHYAIGYQPDAEQAAYLYVTLGHSPLHLGLIACSTPLRTSENNCESYYFTNR